MAHSHLGGVKDTLLAEQGHACAKLEEALAKREEDEATLAVTLRVVSDDLRHNPALVKHVTVR